MLPDFPLQAENGRISAQFLEKRVETFHEALQYIRNLPYGRTSDKKYGSVLPEGRGTCSTKHAVLAQLAQESGHSEIQLTLGIYQMTGENTTGVGTVLQKYGLAYIPEAHCYLMRDGERYDYTRQNQDIHPNVELSNERSVNPEAFSAEKKDYHHAYLKEWLKNEALEFSFDQIWKIREECIQAIS